MSANGSRFQRAALTIAVLGAAGLVACGDRPEPQDSGARAPVPAVARVGEVKGFLVARAARRPVGEIPNLFRETAAGEDGGEIQRMMNAMKSSSDSVGSFHWVNVPPGLYHLFTSRHGIFGEGFRVKAGEVVDLGVVEVP